MSECAFDRLENFDGRLLNATDEHIVSVLSNPSMTTGHSLVITKRHVVPGVDSLTPAEAISMEKEIERLRRIMLAIGFLGVDIFQKTRPFVPEGHNGTKMDHWHVHVLPSKPGSKLYDYELSWGRPDSFSRLTDEELMEMYTRLRVE